jgi:Na+-transporting NADH:ubiquinone oxidoreductase subunit NqrD
MTELVYSLLATFACAISILAISDYLLSLFNNKIVNSGRMVAYRDIFFIICLIFMAVQIVKHFNN